MQVAYEAQLRAFLSALAEDAYNRHRLKFVHIEDDKSMTYVCICGDGYSDRRNWNAHIRESFVPVLTEEDAR